MRRALLLVAAALVSAAVLSTTASATRSTVAASAGRSQTFTRCPRQFNGTKSFGALAVSQIGVRHIACASAYRYIENFPSGLRPYRCTHRFAPPDSFKYVCTDGRKAFRFTGQGE
jgi:hypothetical protein